MEILHRDDLPLGGFAGVREHRLVMDPKAWGAHPNPGTWPGIGNFVYLADARFIPHGDTRLHPHKEIDVISIMVEGRIAHEGSLEHGQELAAGDIQVQRAGGEGFSHNEVNPDDSQNRMIQVWALPEQPGQPAGYKVYRPTSRLMRIYGGEQGQEDTFPAATVVEAGPLAPGETITREGSFVAYLTRGSGTANGDPVKDGDLFRGDALTLGAGEAAQLILVQA